MMSEHSRKGNKQDLVLRFSAMDDDVEAGI